MEERISRGDLGAMSKWLNENVHRPGYVFPAQDLMQKICGKVPDELALAGYLDTKFGELYGV